MKTYVLKNGLVSRRKREQIKEITFELPHRNIIPDVEIFENYLPAIIKKYNILLVDEHFKYCRRFFRLMEIRHLSQIIEIKRLRQIWHRVAALELNRQVRTDSLQYETDVSNHAQRLYRHYYSSSFPERNRFVHYRNFIRCKIVAFALRSDASIIAGDIADYENFADLCGEKIVDAKSFFASCIYRSCKS